MASQVVGDSRLNANNHGPAVVIVAGIMLGTTVVALVMRLQQRWPWTRMLKLEDGVLILATVFSIANVACVALAVQHGLGVHANKATASQLASTKSALIASFAISPIIEGVAAVAFLLLLRSLKPEDRFRRVIDGLSAVVVLWTTAATIRFAAAASNGVAPLDRGTWIGFGVVGMLIQLLLFTAAMWTIWPLQMKVSAKFGVSLWFSLCLPMAAVIGVRLAYTPEQTFDPDFTWNDTNMIMIYLIESNLAIINAAYPSVRSFLNKVSTGWLVPATTKGSRPSRSGSHGLHKIGSGGQRHQRVGSYGRGMKVKESGLSLGDRSVGQHTATVTNDNRSDKSLGSEVIMVRRTVEIDAEDARDIDTSSGSNVP